MESGITVGKQLFLVQLAAISILGWMGSVLRIPIVAYVSGYGTQVEFINASKHWHRLLSSLDNLRLISACSTPDLTRLVGWKIGDERVSQKERKRKISSTIGTRTHNLLLPGQVHYHFAVGESCLCVRKCLGMVRRLRMCMSLWGSCMLDHSEATPHSPTSLCAVWVYTQHAP